MSSSPVRLLPALAMALALALALGSLAACGGSDDGGTDGADAGRDRASEGPAAATTECREQWRALSDQVDEASGGGDGADTATPSTLRSRYVTVAAQVDYYAASATSDDCGDTLATEQATLEGLAAFREQLAPYDVERALADYEADPAVTSYSRPEGAADAPRPARVAAALADLTRLAPQVTAEQAAGWQQATVTDVRDEAARTKAVADLRVVSQEAAIWAQAQAAVAVLDRAAAAAG